MSLLVLSRRVGETICIGDDITVTISQVHGQAVRVSIDAPKSVVVDRLEIRERRNQNPRPDGRP